MSIEVMTRVWKKSQEKGSRLLLLLAIADHTDEFGFAWPGIALLAEKTRMSERQTKRLLNETEETGELYVDRRGYNNRYIVTVGMTDEEIMAVLSDKHRLAHRPDEAAKILVEIKARQQKQGDNLSPCLEDEAPEDAKHSDNLSPCYVKHGDIQGQHSDISGQHSDIDVPLIINESSINQREDEEEEEGRDRILAAVVALYEQEIGGTITAMIADELRELTETERNLERWRKVFRQSIGKGNRWAWVRKVIANPLPKTAPKPQQARPVLGAGKRPPVAQAADAVVQARIQEIIQSRNGG
ncbi:MAG TPA: hypothetical protein PK883_09425 [Anaerolineaceae bacterium]|nr:hypothetical protein [Anaerolineaceae bacterium]